MNHVFCSIPTALKEIKSGKPLILVDDPSRENEGDFFYPAQLITPKIVNFMTKYGRGILCAPMTVAEAIRLHLPLMVTPSRNTEKTRVNFTLSVNARVNGVTTGVSVFDRTKTIKLLVDKTSKPSDFTRPGHVFPLVAAPSGLTDRQGHTEAAVALSVLSNLSPVGVLCEILHPTGHTAKLPFLRTLAKRFHLKIISIADIVSYLANNPISWPYTSPFVPSPRVKLPTPWGMFDLAIFTSLLTQEEHAVVTLGASEFSSGKPVPVRLHSECFTGDVLHSLRCDCGEQLHKSLEYIAKKKFGILLYLQQEGRGIGLFQKIQSYRLQEKGLDTVEANHALGFPSDSRNYRIAAQMLQHLGVNTIELLTNNPQKLEDLAKNGITVTRRIPIETPPTTFNARYLRSKKEKMKHLLENI